MTFSSALILSVFRIVGEDGISKADFQAAAGWTRKFGFGLQDHTRACSFLLERKFLHEVDGRYYRGELSLEPWILSGIESGDSDFEALFELPGFQGSKKFKESLNREIGLLGELHVVSLLKNQVDPDLAYRIEHVSLTNDTAGFDIRTPSVSGVWEEVCLEVKTSSRRERDSVFYLTRNEARVGATNENWFLVFVSLTSEGPRLLGHLAFADIEPYLPKNHPDGFIWTELSGRTPIGDLYVGLP